MATSMTPTMTPRMTNGRRLFLGGSVVGGRRRRTSAGRGVARNRLETSVSIRWFPCCHIST